MGGGGAPKLAGTPLLLITNNPQQVVSGGSAGVTLINPGTQSIILSTDAIPTSSNSFPLPANGASLPIAAGPLWASVSSGMGTLNIFPGILNVFNPNVLSANAGVAIPFIGNQANLLGTAAIPPNIRTVIVTIQTMGTSPGVVSLGATGITSGIPYCQSGVLQKPCYLQNTALGLYTWVFNVSPQVDPTINLAWTFGSTPSGGFTIAINGDTDQYEENIFYNGTATVTETGIAGTLINGPCRVMTLGLAATGGGDTFLQWDSAPILYAPHGLSEQLSYPPNTILPAGHSIILAANGVASVTSAYP